MTQKRIIKKVVVLGADAAACSIACHFANAGLQVLLLGAAGLDEKSKNKPVNDALTAALKLKPSLIYGKSFARNISTGNLSDDMSKIADCDWVLDASDDQLGNPTRFELIDQFRKRGTLITSQIPETAAHLLGCSDDFKKHFCIMRFYNPVRYEPLVDIIAVKYTSQEVIDFLIVYCEKYLGKTAVLSESTSHQAITAEQFISLNAIRDRHTIWKNNSASIIDLGDDIINLEFHSKDNIINSDAFSAIHEAISLAEKSYKGLIIYNEGNNFCLGTDLSILNEQNADGLAKAIKSVQDAVMRVRYSTIPVVVAPHKTTLGAGCELCLHADKVVAHAELYIGLSEFTAGLIPFGGGTKEFTLRLSDELHEGDIETNNFRERFLTLAQAKVSGSAYEAFELGYLKNGRYVVVMSRQRLLAEAKKQCLLLADEGYVQPIKRNDIWVLGKQALGVGYAGANNMFAGNYINERDKALSQKLTFVMAGADLSQPTIVSEDYLLALERETVVSLCVEPETSEKIKNILNKVS